LNKKSTHQAPTTKKGANQPFDDRPLVPFAHDYAHGESEPWHEHDCAQLLHILSGVVRVDTPLGSWVVPPGRGVWLPAGTRHSLRITGQMAARTLFIDPLARADFPAASTASSKWRASGRRW
jgi:mannose-6-phosphate isomerase-like protein (cupin superfamily)